MRAINTNILLWFLMGILVAVVFLLLVGWIEVR